MGVDIIAQDMAALALAARPRVPISLTVLGQSNEHGNVAVGDAAA